MTTTTAPVKTTEPTKLPLEMKKGGFTHKQIKRGKKAAIYSKESDGEIIGYEVFLIKVAPEGERWGKKFEAREVYPGNSSFGASAFCLGNYGNSAAGLIRAGMKYDLLEGEKFEEGELETDGDDEEEEEL